MDFFLFVVSTLLTSSVTMAADCSCGYTIDSTLFTSFLSADFTYPTNISTQTDTVSPFSACGPYGKNAFVNNVIANTYSRNERVRSRILDADAAVQLWVRGEKDVPEGSLIETAKIATREDLLYGSFRASIEVMDGPGTCTAFSWVCSSPLLPSLFPLVA